MRLHRTGRQPLTAVVHSLPGLWSRSRTKFVLKGVGDRSLEMIGVGVEVQLTDSTALVHTSAVEESNCLRFGFLQHSRATGDQAAGFQKRNHTENNKEKIQVILSKPPFKI